MTAAPSFRISTPGPGHGAACRSVLDALPAWFGIPEANDEYVEFVERAMAWTAVDGDGDDGNGGDGGVIGVLAPADHAQSCEIHLLAVLPEWHRRGVGRALVQAFEFDATERRFPLAQVKTLGPSHPDEGYAATRRFYAALGYLELEEFTDLWPGNPALVMVKPLVRRG